MPLTLASRLALVLTLLTSANAQQFTHVVLIVQENRTPDNIFGNNPTFEPGVDIANFGVDASGTTVPFTPVALAACYDLGHSHSAFLTDYAKGAMNGFSKVPVQPLHGCVPGPNPQYRYIDNSTGTIQPYFDLATQYGFANRMFQTNQGPSFPAHQFLLAGTSAPSTDSDLFVSDNPLHQTGSVTNSGCNAPLTATVATVDPNGVMGTTYPCFDHPSLVDSIEAAGLTWRYYTGPGEAIWDAPLSLQGLCNPQVVNGKSSCQGAQWANVTLNPAKVLSDISKCNLANVVWVTPIGQNSDHSSGNKGGGPSWVASIVNAIGNSNCGYWQNTAILVVWDDWGGWVDHVPPPRFGQTGGWGQSYIYGFRVPLIFISAYTPTGYVSNVNHDFGSMLRFIETNFSLGLIGPGNWADSYADDLSDFVAPGSPRSFVTIKAPLKAEHFLNNKEPPMPADND